MTKADIAIRMQSQLGFTKKEKVKIHGFGNFEVKQKKDRLGRNPATGEAMTIKARRITTFKPSGILRVAINQP